MEPATANLRWAQALMEELRADSRAREEALSARLRGEEMPQARPYGVNTPLDKLADCLPPESRVLRRLCPAGPEPDLQERRRLQEAVERWQQLASRADAPPGLAAFQGPLGQLAEGVEARLRGDRVLPSVIEGLERPRGELLLSLPLPLRAWLLATP